MTKQIDAATRSYLNMIRQQNKLRTSKCYECGADSVGINSDKHKVLFVCKEHYTPDSNVVHRVYPEGRKVPEHMMNPNIGGWNKNK